MVLNFNKDLSADFRFLHWLVVYGIIFLFSEITVLFTYNVNCVPKNQSKLYKNYLLGQRTVILILSYILISRRISEMIFEANFP